MYIVSENNTIDGDFGEIDIDTVFNNETRFLNIIDLDITIDIINKLELCILKCKNLKRLILITKMKLINIIKLSKLYYIYIDVGNIYDDNISFIKSNKSIVYEFGTIKTNIKFDIIPVLFHNNKKIIFSPGLDDNDIIFNPKYIKKYIVNLYNFNLFQIKLFNKIPIHIKKIIYKYYSRNKYTKEYLIRLLNNKKIRTRDRYLIKATQISYFMEMLESLIFLE